MLSIDIIKNLEGFKKLNPYWDKLIAETGVDHPFLAFDWHFGWAKHYLDSDQLYILLVYKSDNLIGIAPFYRKRERFSSLFLIRTLEFLGTGEVCTPYLDFIVRPKNRKKVLRAVYDYLYGASAEEWDILCLSDIPAESSSIDIFFGMAQEDGKVINISNQHCNPVICLPESVDKFLAQISGNERYNLKRKEKQLRGMGKLTYIRASRNDDSKEAMESFSKLHNMRWKGNGDGGRFESMRFAKFHGEVLENLMEKGAAYLDFLLMDGEKIAGIYGFSWGGKYYFYLPGINPAKFSKFSPGRLLLFECISKAIKNGDKEFDLLRGPADYKLSWATDLKRTLSLQLFHSGHRGALFQAAKGIKEVIKILVR